MELFDLLRATSRIVKNRTGKEREALQKRTQQQLSDARKEGDALRSQMESERAKLDDDQLYLFWQVRE